MVDWGACERVWGRWLMKTTKGKNIFFCQDDKDKTDIVFNCKKSRETKFIELHKQF